MLLIDVISMWKLIKANSDLIKVIYTNSKYLQNSMN